jgi:hypothetical protein
VDVKYTVEMRLRFPAFLFVALGACSSHPASSSAVDSGDQGADDGSTVGCTGVGGTCEPLASSGCPIVQQNTELCGNVILVCCLPAGGEVVTGGDDAAVADAAVADAGMMHVGPDSGGTPDAGMMHTGMDSGPPAPEAGPDADASIDAPTD